MTLNIFMIKMTRQMFQIKCYGNKRRLLFFHQFLHVCLSDLGLQELHCAPAQWFRAMDHQAALCITFFLFVCLDLWDLHNAPPQWYRATLHQQYIRCPQGAHSAAVVVDDVIVTSQRHVQRHHHNRRTMGLLGGPNILLAPVTEGFLEGFQTKGSKQHQVATLSPLVSRNSCICWVPGRCWTHPWMGAADWLRPLVIVNGDPTCADLITQPELRRILTNQEWGFLLTRGVMIFIHKAIYCCPV